MAAISGSRVTHERVICLRIFADANGESHMEDVNIALHPRQLFKTILHYVSRITSRRLGVTSATYPQACRIIGTIRHSVYWFSG